MRIREFVVWSYVLAIRSIGFEFSLERLRLSGSQGGACARRGLQVFAPKFCLCANFEVPNRHNPIAVITLSPTLYHILSTFRRKYRN